MTNCLSPHKKQEWEVASTTSHLFFWLRKGYGPLIPAEKKGRQFMPTFPNVDYLVQRVDPPGRH